MCNSLLLPKLLFVIVLKVVKNCLYALCISISLISNIPYTFSSHFNRKAKCLSVRFFNILIFLLMKCYISFNSFVTILGNVKASVLMRCSLKFLAFLPFFEETNRVLCDYLYLKYTSIFVFPRIKKKKYV